jgi:urease gamma subunit
MAPPKNRDRKEVQQLIERGKSKGFLTCEEVNDALPADMAAPDQMEDVLGVLGDEDIEIVDAATHVTTAPKTTEVEKLRLLVAAEAAIRALRNASDVENRDEAEAVALFATNVLVGIRDFRNGAALFDPTLLHRMWRVMLGAPAEPRRGDYDGIGARAVVRIVEHSARTLSNAAYAPPDLDPAQAKLHRKVHRDAALHEARHLLRSVDPALDKVGDPELEELLFDIAKKRKAVTGAVADLLIASGALGTGTTEPRADVQRRVTSAMKAR